MCKLIVLYDDYRTSLFMENWEFQSKIFLQVFLASSPKESQLMNVSAAVTMLPTMWYSSQVSRWLTYQAFHDLSKLQHYFRLCRNHLK